MDRTHEPGEEGELLVGLSRHRMGFQELLRISPSSLLMLGCRTSMASVMRQSRYPVLVESISVSCRRILWL